jgi:hypothetical protein
MTVDCKRRRGRVLIVEGVAAALLLAGCGRASAELSTSSSAADGSTATVVASTTSFAVSATRSVCDASLLVVHDLRALSSDDAPAEVDGTSLTRAWMVLEQHVPSELQPDTSLLMSLTLTEDPGDRGPGGRVREFLAEEPFASSSARVQAYVASEACEVSR